jgi:hypothetical protein
MLDLNRVALWLSVALLLARPAIARADTQVTPTHVTPQSSAALGVVTSVAVVPQGAGPAVSIHGAAITTGAVAGFFMILNLATDPGNGAVTPVKCVQVGANQTVGISADPDTMWDFPKGAVLVFSTTGCLLETQSATAFFTWQ